MKGYSSSFGGPALSGRELRLTHPVDQLWGEDKSLCHQLGVWSEPVKTNPLGSSEQVVMTAMDVDREQSGASGRRFQSAVAFAPLAVCEAAKRLGCGVGPMRSDTSDCTGPFPPYSWRRTSRRTLP